MPVTSTGEGRALSSMRNASTRLRAGIHAAQHRAGSFLVHAAKVGILNTAKSGRMYGSHQASAPGEYSAFLTGEHMNSIDYNVQGPRQFEFGAGAEHSVFLELGTSKMEPREDLGQTVRSQQTHITNILGREPYVRLIR